MAAFKCPKCYYMDEDTQIATCFACDDEQIDGAPSLAIHLRTDEHKLKVTKRELQKCYHMDEDTQIATCFACDDEQIDGAPSLAIHLRTDEHKLQKAEWKWRGRKPKETETTFKTRMSAMEPSHVDSHGSWYECDVCGKLLNTPEQLDIHKKSPKCSKAKPADSPTSDRTNWLVCDVCNKKSNSEQQLRSHKESHKKGVKARLIPSEPSGFQPDSDIRSSPYHTASFGEYDMCERELSKAAPDQHRLDISFDDSTVASIISGEKSGRSTEWAKGWSQATVPEGVTEEERELSMQLEQINAAARKPEPSHVRPSPVAESRGVKIGADVRPSRVADSRGVKIGATSSAAKQPGSPANYSFEEFVASMTKEEIEMSKHLEELSMNAKKKKVPTATLR